MALVILVDRIATPLLCIVRRPEVSAPGANRFRLAWPKDMRTKKTTFYCIFEQIGLGTKTEVDQPSS